MDRTLGQHASAAVFAANGPARHRILRVATGAGIALLAAWSMALGLGVFGGLDALPGLPSVHPKESHPANSQALAPAPTPALAPAPTPAFAPAPTPAPRSHSRPAGQPAAKTQQTSPQRLPSGAHGTPTQRSSAPKPLAVKIAPSPGTSGSAQPTSPARGRALGTTKTTNGKPLGSPGNGPGGSGAPGQLR
jgi:hypothetical protein